MSLSIQNGLRWGSIAALVGIISFMIPYVLGSTIIFSLWFGFVAILLWLLFMVFAARDFRQQQGGYATFVQLLQTTFLTITIMLVLTNAFNYVFYNFIDPDFANTLRIKVAENTQHMMQNFNVPEEEIEKAISDIENQDFSMTLTNIVKSTLKGMAAGFVVSLVVSAVMQRKPKQTAS